jgi:hypothetical protein
MEKDLKLKEQMIDFIKSNQIQQNPQQIQQQLKVPFNHESYLKEQRKDSYTWDHFKNNMLFDADFNNVYMKKWTSPTGLYNKMPIKVCSNGVITVKYTGQLLTKLINPDNSINVRKSIENTITNSTDKFKLNILCKTMSNIPENKRPLYCSNVRDKKFYYRNEKNEWIKADDSIFEKIDMKAQGSYFNAMYNTKQAIHLLYKDHYDMTSYATYQQGLDENEQLISDMCLTPVKADNFIEKLKAALAQICKRDSNSYLIDNSIDTSIKKEEFKTDEEQEDVADLYN